MNRIKRLIITAITVLLAIGAFSFNPAKALSFTLVDTFTDNPASRWNCESPSPNQCYFRTNYGRNDYYSAWLQSPGTASNPSPWIAVGRTVIPGPIPAGYRFSTCTVTFSLQNHTSYHYSGGNAALSARIEVINPLTWSYITYRDLTLDRLNLEWSPVTTASFVPIANFYVRVSINKVNGDSRELALDNMILQCTLV